MSEADIEPGARSGRRLLGVASQLLNTATNAATAYVAALLLGPDGFGPFAIAFAVVTIVTATARGLLGFTVITVLPTLGDDDRAIARSIIGLALVAGAVAALVVLVAGQWIDGLSLFSGWVLVAVVHDACRHVAFACGRQDHALAIDVVWGVVQAAVVLVCSAVGVVTASAVVNAWGLGALAGTATFAVVSGLRPRSPVAWWRVSRRHSGWYVAGALLGQAEFYATILIVGVSLTAFDAGGVRATQLLTAQPMIALLGALLAQAIPWAAVAFHTAPATATRQVLVGGLRMVAPVIGLLLVVVLARKPLVELLLPDYAADFTGLVTPSAFLTIAGALGLPAVIALRGMHRLRVDFWLLASRVATTLAVLPFAFAFGSVETGLWVAAGVQLLGSAASWVTVLGPARPRPDSDRPASAPPAVG